MLERRYQTGAGESGDFGVRGLSEIEAAAGGTLETRRAWIEGGLLKPRGRCCRLSLAIPLAQLAEWPFGIRPPRFSAASQSRPDASPPASARRAA